MKRLLAALLLVTLTTPAFAQDCPPDAGGPIAPVADTVRGWSRYDKQTVHRADGSVDRRASARANVEEIAREWRAFRTMDKVENVYGIAEDIPILGAIIAVAALPYAYIADGLDWFAAPTLIVKHAADAAVHAAIGAVR